MHTVRHPASATWWPASAHEFDEPVQIIPADPELAWQYVELGRSASTSTSRSSGCARPNAPRSATWPTPPAFRVGVDPHRGRRPPVGADQPPHRAGWLVAADPAAGDLRQLLRAAAARGRRRTAGSSPGWPIATATPPARPGARCSPASTPPPWSGPPDRVGTRAARGGRRSQVPAETTQAVSELARSRRTTVNTVLQGAWAQLLMLADRPARCRLRHRGLGPAGRAGRRGIDGGPVDQHGAGAGRHHRGHHHRRPARPAAKRLQPTPSSTSTWRSTRFTAPPATTSCSTPCSSTRTIPIDTARVVGRSTSLAITEFTSREYNHYPLTVQAMPGARAAACASNTTPTCSTRRASTR